jgi:hypothetical protein
MFVWVDRLEWVSSDMQAILVNITTYSAWMVPGIINSRQQSAYRRYCSSWWMKNNTKTV